MYVETGFIPKISSSLNVGWCKMRNRDSLGDSVTECILYCVDGINVSTMQSGALWDLCLGDSPNRNPHQNTSDTQD